ncbi:MAG: hypothetical protein P1U63_10320 [Coxiellaceae bacterium]|nr:hypothetical protein [Coxiellaceae bacterium]
MRDINYLWVGPPASRRTGVISGQDTIGPMNFKGENCRFWCLATHADHYKETFSSQDNVTIMPIEPYLDACASDDANPLADEAKNTQTFFLKLLSGDRGSVRDRVSAKELFSFFLLTQSGGYVADSNVLFKNPELLVERDCFTFPCYRIRRAYPSDVDIWMMYSPPGLERTLLSLQKLITSFTHIEARKTRPATAASRMFVSPKEHNTHTTAALLALLAPGRDRTDVWMTSQKTEHDVTAKLLTVGAEKHFFNTHKIDATQDQAFMYLQANELEALSYLLTHGEDINQTMNQLPIYNLTLLHSAIWRQSPDAVAFVLEHKPDLNKKAIHGGRGYTAAQFITLLLNNKPPEDQKEKLQACQEILTKYMAAASDEATASAVDVTGREGGASATASETPSPATFGS